MLNRRRAKVDRDRSRKLVGTLALIAIGIGALGAYGVASQGRPQTSSVLPPQSAMIRTTPDAPREVPPPVEPTK